MKEEGLVFKIKYSIVDKTGQEKSHVYRKKTEKKIAWNDTNAILDEIDSFEHCLEHQHRVSKSLSRNMAFQRVMKFLRSWKYTYYEILSL